MRPEAVELLVGPAAEQEPPGVRHAHAGLLHRDLVVVAVPPAAAFEAAAGVLVRAARALHHPVEGHAGPRRDLHDSTSWLIENSAPAGSANAAFLPTGLGVTGSTTRPPSSSARATARSASVIQKSGLQRGGPPSTITATTSRGTGCEGSPPKNPGRRNIVAGPNGSVCQPKT